MCTHTHRNRLDPFIHLISSNIRKWVFVRFVLHCCINFVFEYQIVDWTMYEHRDSKTPLNSNLIEYFRYLFLFFFSIYSVKWLEPHNRPPSLKARIQSILYTYAYRCLCAYIISSVLCFLSWMTERIWAPNYLCTKLHWPKKHTLKTKKNFALKNIRKKLLKTMNKNKKK